MDYTFNQNIFQFSQRMIIISILSQIINAFQTYHKEGASVTKSIENDIMELNKRQNELRYTPYSKSELIPITHAIIQYSTRTEFRAMD